MEDLKTKAIEATELIPDGKGDSCGLCGTPVQGAAVKASFKVNLIFTTKEINRILHLGCAKVLGERLIRLSLG
jgi:hypothetical protein